MDLVNINQPDIKLSYASPRRFRNPRNYPTQPIQSILPTQPVQPPQPAPLEIIQVPVQSQIVLPPKVEGSVLMRRRNAPIQIQTIIPTRPIVQTQPVQQIQIQPVQIQLEQKVQPVQIQQVQIQPESKSIPLDNNQRMANIIESEAREMKEVYRRNALLRGVNWLRKFPQPITNVQQILDLPKDERKEIGSDPKHGVLKRIQDILESGVLQTQPAQLEKSIHAELEQVLGVGPATSQNLVNQGVTGIADLRNKVALGQIPLNRIQMIGLENLEDLQKKISRAEVKEMGEHILSVAHRLDSATQGEIVGSYRRGKSTSGDIDILITNPNKNPIVPLIKALEEEKFIVHIISGDPDATKSKFDIVKFQGTHREKGILHKFDIRFVPVEHWATSILHSTGSDQFNIMIRQQAIAQGKKLSEHGLFQLKGTEEIRIPVDTEADIFKDLGMPYWSPEQRDL